jgi:hypothetical protein
MKEAALKHFVERLRPVFDDGRYAGAIDIEKPRVAIRGAFQDGEKSACPRAFFEQLPNVVGKLTSEVGAS